MLLRTLTSRLTSAALLLTLATPAAAFPSSFTSAGLSLPAVSARGQAFGNMGITNYEAAADPICAWTHNVPNTGYVVGSAYTLWIGNKADGAAATVGMVYKVGTAANANTGSDGGSKMAFKEIDWTATDVASVELKAICGAGGSKMWIAEPVTLNKAAAVNCALGPAVTGSDCQAACGTLTQTIATPASNGGTPCGTQGTHTCANGEGSCVQANSSVVSTPSGSTQSSGSPAPAPSPKIDIKLYIAPTLGGLAGFAALAGGVAFFLQKQQLRRQREATDKPATSVVPQPES